jgi:predicted O-methyltransferase YrrM
MQKLQLILRYLKYLNQSKTKYDIHSPFLFDLITQVFEDKSKYPDYAKVEQLKNELLKNKELITVTDLGAGSIVDRGNERSISSIAQNASKSKKIGRLLFRMTKYFKPGNIIELGTSLGLSTLYLAYGNPNSNIITIEGCPNISKIAGDNFHKLGMDQINQVTGNFDDQLAKVLKPIDRLDFAFIDGNHQQEPTINYFEQCLVKSHSNSIFIFDDIHWSEGMEKAWENIISHPDVSLSVDIFYMGIVFLKKELTKQHFVIRF